jgi:hypothetical protein
VWRYLRQTQPNLELYDSDGSHPSLLGSYAAAVCFYSTLFQKSATLVKTDAGLNPASAAAVRAAVNAVVFDSLPRWNVGQWGAEAAFAAQVSGQTVQFFQQSLDAQSYEWSFGDGTTSTAISPAHTYSANGSYSVVLRAIGCATEDTAYATVVVGGMGSVEPESRHATFWPNPARDRVEWVPTTGWVDVLDAVGRCVTRWPAEHGEAEVQFLAPGLYSLRTGDGVVCRWVRIR